MQVSAASHTPVDWHQTNVDGLKLSTGQAELVPMHVLILSSETEDKYKQCERMDVEGMDVKGMGWR